MASRPSDKLVRFAAGINRGLSGSEAAREAGYGEFTIRNPGPSLDRARAAGLILTIEEARAPLDIMRARVSDDDWREIVDAAIGKAKAGDVAALTWIRDTLIGKPSQPVSHGGGVSVTFAYDDTAPGLPSEDDDPA